MRLNDIIKAMTFDQRWRLAVVSLAVGAAGCSGTVPRFEGTPERNIGGIIIGARGIVATGETRYGGATLNLEGEGGRRAHIYRLPIKFGEPKLFRIEPGTYRLAPERSNLGYHRKYLEVMVEGRIYRLPFPRDIMRKDDIKVPQRKIVPLGIIEARIVPALPGKKPELRIRFDDSLKTRRRLVEDMIRKMTDPRVPLKERQSVLSWAKALDRALMNLAAQRKKSPLFKSFKP